MLFFFEMFHRRDKPVKKKKNLYGRAGFPKGKENLCASLSSVLTVPSFPRWNSQLSTDGGGSIGSVKICCSFLHRNPRQGHRRSTRVLASLRSRFHTGTNKCTLSLTNNTCAHSWPLTQAQRQNCRLLCWLTKWSLSLKKYAFPASLTLSSCQRHTV